MAPGPLGEHGARRPEGAERRHRIRLDDLPALPALPRRRLSRRSRRNTSTPARSISSSASSRSIRWRRRRSCSRAARRRSAYFPIVDLLFDQQRNWAFVDDPETALFSLVKQAGFTQESFEACLTNQKILDGVNCGAGSRGNDTFGVDATPTFFFNGEKEAGEHVAGGNRQAAWRLDAESPAGPRWPAPSDERPLDGSSVGEVHASARSRLQVLRRADRIPDRAGPDRRRRPERLRQVEPRRGAPLGDGRELVQEHARVRHGRRHLLGQPQPPGAQHGRSLARRRQCRPHGAGRLQRCRGDRDHAGASSARPARSTASTAATCAPATCSCSSPTPRPARIRRRWSARAGSAS